MVRQVKIGALLAWFIGSFFGVQATSAQETAADLLPTAAALGEGWTELADLPPREDLVSAFKDGAYGVYGGPDGSRVVVVAFLVAEGMTAIRQSWEAGNETFDAYRIEIDYGFQSSRETDLAEQPLPAACADARRIFGVDEIGFQSFPVGLTLCAADPDIILMVYASGSVQGLDGYQASDRVTEIVLSQGDGTSSETGA